ncbi:transcriptional regulator, TraR/DksA family [Malonomonas rubra DSM 5091]|uniref:Transcriptional regulator, TraR/DksA family n=1 Tax=Malonomonas rubra DSM 5091 TaxID=1122189 RepID=A0A1M6E7E8_MALRU|nr:TraR/DksA C4-type zinc finger protein [Malonomonas rubra]SHI81208.1 transcriptional regulator, TraR/DksA family [Malonomonas rubra DSM 5091]
MSEIEITYQPSSNESYMNDQQLAYFRGQLIDWRNRLNSESRLSRQRLLENDPNGGDILDQSVKDSNRTMDFLARSRQQKLILQIDAALGRLEDGSFGYCLESGEEIGIKRLLAYPIATLSVEAQELLERRRSHQAA